MRVNAARQRHLRPNLFQFRVFCSSRFEYRNVRVRVFPPPQELLIIGPRRRLVSDQYLSPRLAQQRQ